MSLFKPQEGKVYSKDQVVSLCLTYIHSPKFKGNVSEKEQKISLIGNKRGEYLQFHARGHGWGSSAMNPNCWNPIQLDSRNQPLSESRQFVNLLHSRGGADNGRKSMASQDRDTDIPLQNGGKRTRETGGTSEALYNQRPWQAAYRNQLLRIWGACAVSGCRITSLLTASHIKPVIHCTESEKTDPYNGIFLSKVFDALFDRGLISFEDDGRILISSSLQEEDLARVS